MNLLSKKLPKKSVLVAGLSLGVCLSLLGLGNKVNAAEAPQTVNVGNSSKIVTYASGHAAHYGPHEVSVIKEAGTGQYLFCIEWSKRAPSNEQISKRYQANPSVQWLVNNFYSNNRFQSLGQGDEGDYWLYQSAIHWVADPNDHATWGGTGAIQDVLGRLDPGVRAKVEALRNEALKHNDESTSEIVTNNHNLGFDPGNLEINNNDLQGNTYKKTFTLKSENMFNVHVSLKNAPEGVSLAGKDNPVNFNDVWNNTGLQLNIPYKVNADKDSYSFTVATKGNWEKTSKVAWVYAGNGNSQKVTKPDVKAVSVPLDAETDMNVTVRPAKGHLSFTKKGTGNNKTEVLKNTEFKLTSGDFSQTAVADDNGNVSFNNLPLGRDYKLSETKQPNKYYNGTYRSNYSETLMVIVPK
ncbi:collagen binding domain-containing protein [Lactobacillus sp. AN1001]